MDTACSEIIHSTNQRADAICRLRYGFVADPLQSRFTNLKTRLCQLTLEELTARPTNLQSHNRCESLDVPPLAIRLLGLGLSFCLTSNRPQTHHAVNWERFRRDIRTRFQLAGLPDSDYNPKLHVPDPNWQPDPASIRLEQAMNRFIHHLQSKFASQRHRCPHPNLRLFEFNALQSLRTHNDLLVCHTDKNLGPVVINRSTYINRALQEHLLNENNYERLTSTDADNHLEQNFRSILKLVEDYIENPFNPDKDSKKYFRRKLCQHRKDGRYIRPPDERVPHFYLLPKLHKNPWKTRPVVSCVGSTLEILSSWLDCQLQRVIHLCPSKLKDSNHVLADLRRLGPLPPNAVIFSADAQSMYSNINTKHGIHVMEQWLALHEHELPSGFPLQEVVDGIALVMQNNVFQFGDLFFRQKNGTAMGTSVAVAYATIYYSFHEETFLSPAFDSWGILYYKRFIDDAIIIMLMSSSDDSTYKAFGEAMNSFGEHGSRLTWDVTAPGRTLDFLDLTISILDNGSIQTCTYQKPLNLFLYLPATSAHPPGVLFGLVYGMFQRFWLQCTQHEDFLRLVESFFKQLLARGYTFGSLAPVFTRAADLLSRNFPFPDEPWRRIPREDDADTSVEQLFLHVKYQPESVPRQDFQKAFSLFLAQALNDEQNEDGYSVGRCRLTVAYSRARNIADVTGRTRLRNFTKDVPVSKYLG